MPPTLTLEQALLRHSPRFSPRAVPLASRAISVGVVALFVMLVVQAFLRHGLAAWSAGVVYILYDTALLAFTFRETLPLRRGSGRAPHAVLPPTLGVIVAAHNEAGVIAVTIDRLAGQADPPNLILIADDGSSDGTAQALAERYGLAAPPLGEVAASPVLPSLRWLRVAHGGKARALNAAMLRAETEVIVTVDADTLLEDDAIAAMRDAFAEDAHLVAATGVLRPICGPSLSGRLFQWFQTYEYVRNFLSRYAWMRQEGLLLVSGAFAAFRREAVVKVGGFDPDCLVEDYELIHRLQRYGADNKLGWRVRVVGAARARTDAPASVMGFLRQRRRWFGGFLQTQHWYREMVGNPSYARLGTRMLPVKALDTMQPVFGLAAFALLVWFVATGRYAIAFPILLVMIAKVAVDLTFHLWSLHLYTRWTGQKKGLEIGPAVLAAFAEPFSFQLLRHAGAAWGWWTFLTGRSTWGRQRRTAIAAGAA